VSNQNSKQITNNEKHDSKMQNYAPITRGIIHWGLSGYSSILPRIKFGVTGQESSPQSPTISYRHRRVCLESIRKSGKNAVQKMEVL